MLVSSRKAQLGLNLVELMIGLVIGLIVLAAMTTVYLNASRGSKDTLNANRLNQDLRAVMDIMVADIRRAGYWADASAGTDNLFTNATSDITVASDCILYSYDATYKPGSTAGGAPEPGGIDFFGFRRGTTNGVGAVQLVTNLGDTSMACSDASLIWQNLTDPAVIEITQLAFSTAGSQCLNVDDSTAAPVVVAAGGVAKACSTGAAAGWTGNRAETRQINITITARHRSDPTTLTRTLSESVVLRNNRIINP